jgi:hypothetical protein
MVPVTWKEAAAVQQLPVHHRDPFDRLLVAQARAEGWPLVTRDRVFRRYGVEVIGPSRPVRRAETASARPGAQVTSSSPPL